jgi:GT2 family glycosyltransferase
MLQSGPFGKGIDSHFPRKEIFFVQVREADGLFEPVPRGAWVIATVSNQVVARHAEREFAYHIECNPECMIIYADYDRISSAGTRYGPNFKPCLNIDLAYSDPMYSIGTVFRADVWNDALARLSTYSSKPSAYGIFLEALILAHPKHVVHLPKVLFHLVDPPCETPSLNTLVRASHDSALTARRFLEVHYPDLEVEVQLVKEGVCGQQVLWPMPKSPLLVSILLPTRDAYKLISACISSLFTISAGVEYELIIVDNGTVDRDALRLFESLDKHQNVSIIRDDGPFNYSALVNKGARVAKGDVLCLLNNDTKVITENWLALLSAHAVRAEVGCVGPMLLYADHTVQHAGVVLGIGGIAGHAHKYLSSDALGFQARLQLCHNFSAVTGACLVVRRSLWCSLDGFDERHLPINYNDVDFCLRAISAGFRNLYVPQVKLCHYESKSRGNPRGAAFQQWQDERKVMLKRWGPLIECDPAYSPHLSLIHEDFSLSLRTENLSSRIPGAPSSFRPSIDEA